MKLLTSVVQTSSAEFRRRYAHNKALAKELKGQRWDSDKSVWK